MEDIYGCQYLAGVVCREDCCLYKLDYCKIDCDHKETPYHCSIHNGIVLGFTEESKDKLLEEIIMLMIKEGGKEND